MPTRYAFVLSLLSVAASAQNVSGTFSGSFTDFDQYGIAHVHLDLSLTCSLSCPSSASDLHYGYDANQTSMAAAPMLSPDGVAISAVDPATGSASWDTPAPAGSNFTATVKGATCFCGDITGEGGFIDLTTAPIQVPPWFNVLAKPVKAGSDPLIILNATPVAGEVVQVHLFGGGVEYTHSFTAADFMTETSGDVSTKGVMLPVTFTSAGTVTATASVGDGPVQTQTFEVVGPSSTGGGMSGTGGGAPELSGPSAPEPAGGCAAAPGLMPLAALLLLRRRQVRR